MAFDESKLRKAALLTIPVVGLFACLFLAAGAFLLFQAREALTTGESGIGGVVSRLNGTVDVLNATLEHVNRPCKGSDGPDACGTLAQVNKTAIGIGDLVVTTQKQTTLVATMVGQYGTVLQSVAGDIHDTSTALAGTANAATETIAAAKPSLDTANIFLAHLDAETAPLLDKSTLFVANASALTLQVQPLVRHIDQGLVTGDHMLSTADQIETKASQCFLHPTFGCVAKGMIMPAAQIGGGVAQMMK